MASLFDTADPTSAPEPPCASHADLFQPGGYARMTRPVPLLGGMIRAGTLLKITAVGRDHFGPVLNVTTRDGRSASCVPAEALTPAKDREA